MPQTNNMAKPIEVQSQFSNYLKTALNEVNNNQLASNKATEMLVNNEGVELHDVLIAQQKASISLQLTMEVRNKAIEAYQEIMRMQV
ncbi:MULTISPECIES: flagellar hook-basal body complex protein FliE [Sutcliffiella]|uniref:Flagellar hook-basal body complex protein FliE n=1 Tax=Sutcliffiella cohnii TaxID=33932 RepID=A0A223KY00_9BACI|nr:MULTISPECIES: flagellar hook-basal body complex protein FliE [Sutcliffiella]AST94342.1 flagellar hook-basal body complex protein FliE [Sutcliffiella cohnii]MED4015344.1 flagellar hook-basal body complex protein FliE [Sutcliffiella cohnii]WBL17613.1 flagellar hook-basal body complex protein FliE [Sutcliffiella sp. NC1]